MKSKLASVLGKFDIFGIPIQLTVKGESHYKTSLGGVTSLTVLALAWYLYISAAQKILLGGSPLVSSKVEYVSDPKEYVYNYDDFFVAIGLADTKGIPILNSENQTYYDVILKMVTRTSDGSQLDTQIMQLVPCMSESSDKNQISIVIDWILNISTLKFAYCINKTQYQAINKSYSLEGIYSSQRLKYLKLNVYACRADASSLPADCHEKMSKGYSLSIISDKLTDQISENPFKTIGRTLIDSFEIKRIQEVRMYFQRVYLLSISSFYYFTSSQVLYDSLQYQQSRYLNYDLYDLKSEAILSYTWSMSDTEIYSYRSYKNMIDVLAETAAITNMIILILRIILHRISQDQLRKDLDKFLFQDSPKRLKPQVSQIQNQLILPNRNSQDRVDLFSIVKQLQQLELIIDSTKSEDKNQESSWVVNLEQGEYQPITFKQYEKPKEKDNRIYPEG